MCASSEHVIARELDDGKHFGMTGELDIVAQRRAAGRRRIGEPLDAAIADRLAQVIDG
jgi:hypothetical protein